jgi:hypothetical protein
MRDKQFERGLHDMIEYINKRSPTKNMRLVEIGAYMGESTAIFCQNFKSVITIDPFLNGYDASDKVCSELVPMHLIHAEFCVRMSKYNNYELIRKKSNDAIKYLTDRPVVHCCDVVYIDGMHQYAQVKKDILNYRDIVNKGGFVTGHDYCTIWPGVKKAVDELYGAPHMNFIDGSWLVRKST